MTDGEVERDDKKLASSNGQRGFGDGEAFVSRFRTRRRKLERKQQGEGNRSFRQERLDGTLLEKIRINRAFEKCENWGWTTHGLRALLGDMISLEDLEASRYTTRSVTNVEGQEAHKSPKTQGCGSSGREGETDRERANRWPLDQVHWEPGGSLEEDRERCVNMEGCLQATRALAKKPPTSKAWSVASIKADVGAIIGLEHNGSSRDTRSKSEQGSIRQGYRARQRFFAGSLQLML